MKISPAGFPGLLLVFLAASGAYVLFGRQSFVILVAVGLIAGSITAILIGRRNMKPEKQTLALTEHNEAAEQVTAADTARGSSGAPLAKS